ncbi:hypothetical protein GCM10022420_088140 [Streptomyces iranensis]
MGMAPEAMTNPKSPADPFRSSTAKDRATAVMPSPSKEVVSPMKNRRNVLSRKTDQAMNDLF